MFNTLFAFVDRTAASICRHDKDALTVTGEEELAMVVEEKQVNQPDNWRALAQLG